MSLGRIYAEYHHRSYYFSNFRFLLIRFRRKQANNHLVFTHRKCRLALTALLTLVAQHRSLSWWPWKHNKYSLEMVKRKNLKISERNENKTSLKSQESWGLPKGDISQCFSLESYCLFRVVVQNRITGEIWTFMWIVKTRPEMNEIRSKYVSKDQTLQKRSTRSCKSFWWAVKSLMRMGKSKTNQVISRTLS